MTSSDGVQVVRWTHDRYPSDVVDKGPDGCMASPTEPCTSLPKPVLSVLKPFLRCPKLSKSVPEFNDDRGNVE